MIFKTFPPRFVFSFSSAACCYLDMNILRRSVLTKNLVFHPTLGRGGGEADCWIHFLFIKNLVFELSLDL